MGRTFVAVLAVLLALGPATAQAQTALPPSLTVDKRFAPFDGIAREDLAGAATDIPSAIAVAGERIYTVGEARDSAGDSNLGIVARRSDGLYDNGFSGDGRLVLPIAPGTGKDVATDIVVLPDGRLRILASTDVDPSATSQIDVAIVGLTADGGPDPSFGAGGSGRVVFPAAATTGADTPTRMALGPDGRLAVTGAASNGTKEDVFVSLREPDGSPVAGFGTTGVRVVDVAGSAALNDRGVDIAFRPGGGLLVLAQVETNPGDANDFQALLRAFTEETAADDARFAGTGSLGLPAGAAETVPGGLLVYDGRVWASGWVRVATNDRDAFLARVSADGRGFEARIYDVLGTAIDADDVVDSAGSDLDVVPGATPTLVVTGSINYNSRPYWAAAAFNNLGGPLASAGFGDVLIPTDEYGAIVGVAAGPSGWAGIAGSLVDTSSNFDTSFGTARLLVDTDKACDLALEVVEPLELSIPTSRAAPLTLRVANNGTKACAGTLSTAGEYALEGATTLELGPGGVHTTAGLRVRYDGPRRRDDTLQLRVAGAGDPNDKNDARTLNVLFPYCELDLDGGDAPRAPTEGPRRYELSVRNPGTMPCQGVHVQVAAGGSLAGAADRFMLRPGRSATVDVRAVVAPGGRAGDRATLTFRAAAPGAVDPDGAVATLRPKLIGVGDSDVRAAGARGFRGTARGGKGAKDKERLAVRAVEVAAQRVGKGCRSLADASGRLRVARRGRACAKVWIEARGTRRWRLTLRRPLPRGRYVVHSRAVIGAGFREGRFSAADRNQLTFRVP